MLQTSFELLLLDMQFMYLLLFFVIIVICAVYRLLFVVMHATSKLNL